MPPARLLTTDRCPGYLRGLAAAGIRVDRLARSSTDPLAGWERARELRDAVRSVSREQARQALERGHYTAVVCHAPLDLVSIDTASTPTVLVLHEPLPLLELFGDGPASWDADLTDRFTRTSVVCAGDDVRWSWRLDAPVIPPAVDVADWDQSDYSGGAVTVAPFAIERAALDTAYLLSAISAGPGATALGANPALGIDSNTASLPARRQAFRSARVYVNLNNPLFEPTAPMPMLEAMAAGLPIVSLAGEASPIVHEVNGLVAASAEELVSHTRTLVDHAVRARELGARARATIQEQYSQDAFTARWADVLSRLPRSARQIA